MCLQLPEIGSTTLQHLFSNHSRELCAEDSLWELVNDFHLTSDRRKIANLCGFDSCLIYLCVLHLWLY